MKYIIDEKLFNNYPDLRIGIVVGKGLTNSSSNNELRKEIRKNINIFLNKYNSTNLLEHPNILKWRDTYKSFGVKPKDHKPTAEALLRRILNDHPFPAINTAVDAYLAVEPLHLLPIGGYDLDRVEGNILLRYSDGGELFHPLGGGVEEKTNHGEVVYSDDTKILTRRWNYKDSDYAKITIDSTRIVLASEAAYPEILASDIENTIEKIVEYEQMFCGGTYRVFYLNKNIREVEL